MLKFKIKEDTITEYLDKLGEAAEDTSNQKRFLQDAAQELHMDYIEPLMPTWNPNLIFSALEKKNQDFTSEGALSILKLVYTGFTEEARHDGLENIYWEFGDPYEHILDRDYAFYQETGYDEFAESENTKAPTFKGHHFVKKGTESYLNRYHDRTRAYADTLLHLSDWSTETRIGRTSYMEDWFDRHW